MKRTLLFAVLALALIAPPAFTGGSETSTGGSGGAQICLPGIKCQAAAITPAPIWLANPGWCADNRDACVDYCGETCVPG